MENSLEDSGDDRSGADADSAAAVAHSNEGAGPGLRVKEKAIKLVISTISGLEAECAKEAESLGLSVISVKENSGFIIASSESAAVQNYLLRTTTATNVMAHLCTIAGEEDDSSGANAQLSSSGGNFLAEDCNEKLIEKMKKIDASFCAVKIIGKREDEMAAGKYLHEKRGFRVILDSPKVRIGTIRSEEDIILGLLLNSSDLSVREYRLYRTPSSQNACIYSAALNAASAGGNENFIDPLAADGSFCIEYYYLASRKSPLEHDEEKISEDALQIALGITKSTREAIDEINSISRSEEDGDSNERVFSILCNDSNSNNLMRARQNARLAGCEGALRFSGSSLEWSYLKLEEKSFTLIASQLPFLSRNFSEKKYSRLAAEYAELCAAIMNDDGRAIVISNEKGIFISAMREKGLYAVSEKEIRRGDALLYLLLFRRGNTALFNMAEGER